MLLINATHEGSSRREDLVDKDEDGLLGGELDALADDIDELAHGEVGRHQVLLLINRSDVALLNLLADDLNTDNPSEAGSCKGGPAIAPSPADGGAEER